MREALSSRSPTRATTGALGLLAALVVVASIAFWLSEPYPLSHAHWDSAVYLAEGKSYADGGYLPRFRARAAAVRDELMQGGYPRESWLFTRLGHIVLVGEAVEMVGERASIGSIVTLYRIVFGLAVLTAVVGALNLSRLAPSVPAPAIYLGAALSLLLYLLSDVASYMSGNLVSEVPAMFLLTSSVWTFSLAWTNRSVALAILSGCLGFLVYAVRMEAVWIYLSFLIAFGVLVAMPERNVTTVIVAASTALILFAAYSWYFFPLTDPRLFALGTGAGVKLLGPSTGGTVSQVFAANGLLWIGGGLAIALARSSRATRVGALWLVLAMVPIAVALAASYATQTRMFTMLMPILMLLSTIGWSSLIARVQQGGPRHLLTAMLALCAIGVVLSQPSTYARLHALPGMWRLQYLHEFLASQRFERVDYYLPELEQISHAIALLPMPCTIVVSERLQGADHIMVVQYLGSFGDDAWNKGSARRRSTSDAQPVRIYLSVDPVKDLEFAAARASEPLFLLSRTEEKSWREGFARLGTLEDVEVTPHFALKRISRTGLALARLGVRGSVALLATP